VVTWESRLTGVVGNAHKQLEEVLGLRTVGDLLMHLPRRYIDRSRISRLRDITPGEHALVVVDVVSAEIKPYQDRRTRRTAYRVAAQSEMEGGEQVSVTFFDRHRGGAEWHVKQLRPGGRVMLSGRLELKTFKGVQRWELTHPEILDDLETTGLKPVYPVGGKLSSLKVEKAVRAVLDVMPEVPDMVPDAVREEHGLVDAETALRWAHRPEDWDRRAQAWRRLRFEEAFVAQVALARRRAARAEVYAEPRSGRAGGLLDAFEERMPFELTAGQHAVEADITSDLAAPRPMQRLLQGEVGSGKTVVALRAMLRVVDSGAQAALLAPTEVLAQQHHRSVTRMLGDLAGAGMLGADERATGVTLLTGSLTAAARRQALEAVASGESGIVIGTHALIQEGVDFRDLGLVVVDEQHRFGVEQRATLAAKAGDGAAPPHELVMTATPIPRTVAMTVFGDLETSALTELPAGRSPIQTTVVALQDHPGWLDRAWQRVREEVERGRQVYVVCPRISADAPEDDAGEDPTEADEAEVRGGGTTDGADAAARMASVEQVTPALSDGPLRGLRVAPLHGRMPPEEKDRVMTSFAAGEVDVLVATTVIEVGVDVGNATTMVVLDADRFGLSQLHQLRGRVGRGGHPGLCLLVSDAAPGTPARERLDAVASTTDGFALAERDLELRREGDVLGRSQSGLHKKLRLLSVTRDAELIVASREAAARMVGRDPDLAGHHDLRVAVAELEATSRAEYLEKA
jgi:ATP-dependent DNA helicase RecG